jgi:hypothetical protein
MKTYYLSEEEKPKGRSKEALNTVKNLSETNIFSKLRLNQSGQKEYFYVNKSRIQSIQPAENTFLVAFCRPFCLTARRIRRDNPLFQITA